MQLVTPDDDARKAKLQELSHSVDRAEAAVTSAMERQDAIADESFETPEQEADIQRRVNELDDEIAVLQEACDEVEREFNVALSDDDDDDQEGDAESLSLEDAKDIWLSHGMDPDYAFGYTEEELKREAGLD